MKWGRKFLRKLTLRLSKKWLCHFFEKGCGPLRALVVRFQRTTRTLAGREVFFPTYMPPEKTNFILFAPAGANSARLFRQAGRKFLRKLSLFETRLKMNITMELSPLLLQKESSYDLLRTSSIRFWKDPPGHYLVLREKVWPTGQAFDLWAIQTWIRFPAAVPAAAQVSLYLRRAIGFLRKSGQCTHQAADFRGSQADVSSENTVKIVWRGIPEVCR